MKKLLIFILLTTLIIPALLINTYALDFSGSVEGDYEYVYDRTISNTYYYDLRIKVDDVLLNQDMTTWYNAFDNIYATPHVYYLEYPVSFVNNTTVINSDVKTIHVDYDIGGSSTSYLNLYNSSDVLVYQNTMNNLVSSMFFGTTIPLDYDYLYDYGLDITDDFTHVLNNWDFTFGLLDWFDLSEDEDTWEVIDGGAFDGVLRVTTVDSNSMLRNYSSLDIGDTYYIRYTSVYGSGTGYIDGFNNNLYIDEDGTFDYIEVANSSTFDLIALDDGTDYYIDDIVVLNLTDIFGIEYPTIAQLNFLVNLWLGIDEVYEVNFYDFDDTLLKYEIVLYNESATPPSDPSRLGYTFSGWDTTYTNVTSDLNIYATYTAIDYSVSYETNGGTPIPVEYYNIGDQVIRPVDPIKEGFIFVGWYRNANFTQPMNFNTYTMGTENITLYAKYTSNIEDKIEDFLDDSAFSSTFGKIVISVVIILLITITLALFKTSLFVILIVDVALFLLAIMLGFIPIWITILLTIIAFFLLYLSIKGGGSND